MAFPHNADAAQDVVNRFFFDAGKAAEAAAFGGRPQPFHRFDLELVKKKFRLFGADGRNLDDPKALQSAAAAIDLNKLAALK